MPRLLQMRDAFSDSLTVKKPKVWDLPFRLCIAARTGAGKTNTLGNLLLRKDLYRGDFNGEDIYVFSGSLATDTKLRTIIDELDIPASNCFAEYSDGALHAIYDHVTTEFRHCVDEGGRPPQSLIIIDDCSFGGKLSRNGAKDDALQRVAMNGRKLNVSLCVLVQKYSQLSTAVRENLSGAMLGSATNKQVDLIGGDWDHLKRKGDFAKMFRAQTRGPHDYLILDIANPALYLDHDFSPLPHMADSRQ